MSTVAPRTSSSAVPPLIEGSGGLRQNAAQVRGLWQEFGRNGLAELRPQSETSIDRGFRIRGPVEDEWGQSESFDPDNVGDIADEGMGHRG